VYSIWRCDRKVWGDQARLLGFQAGSVNSQDSAWFWLILDNN
jgi:hypothetical protein